MKTLIILVIAFIALGAQAQEIKTDTNYFQKGNDLIRETVVIKTFRDTASMTKKDNGIEFNIFSNNEVKKKPEKGEKMNLTLTDNGMIIEKVIRDTISIAKIIAKIQEGIDINIFSESEIRDLAKGKVVKKEDLDTTRVLKLLPTLKETGYVNTSSYKLVDGTLKNISNEPKAIYSDKETAISITWIYVPAILVFLVFYIRFKNKKSRVAREKLIIFSIVMTAVIITSIIIGKYTASQLIHGFVGGVGCVCGFSICLSIEKPEKTSLIEAFLGAIAILISGTLTGVVSGAITATDGINHGVLWRYVLIYASILIIAFVIREVIVLVRKDKYLTTTTEKPGIRI